MKRQVRYNISTDTGEQISMRHRWTVFLLNEPREIERIQERFLRELAPAGELQINYESLIENSGGLHAKIISFSSDQGKVEDHRKIYDSENFRRDRDLWEREETAYDSYIRRHTR